MPKASYFNRVCFWLPRPWRIRLLAVMRSDGRGQGEFVRDGVISAIERAEDRQAVVAKLAEKK